MGFHLWFGVGIGVEGVKVHFILKAPFRAVSEWEVRPRSERASPVALSGSAFLFHTAGRLFINSKRKPIRPKEARLYVASFC